MSASNERVAIVAGAGGELGRATAEKLAAAGLFAELSAEDPPAPQVTA